MSTAILFTEGDRNEKKLLDEFFLIGNNRNNKVWQQSAKTFRVKSQCNGKLPKMLSFILLLLNSNTISTEQYFWHRFQYFSWIRIGQNWALHFQLSFLPFLLGITFRACLWVQCKWWHYKNYLKRACHVTEICCQVTIFLQKIETSGSSFFPIWFFTNRKQTKKNSWNREVK